MVGQTKASLRLAPSYLIEFDSHMASCFRSLDPAQPALHQRVILCDRAARTESSVLVTR